MVEMKARELFTSNTGILQFDSEKKLKTYLTVISEMILVDFTTSKPSLKIENEQHIFSVSIKFKKRKVNCDSRVPKV